MRNSKKKGIRKLEEDMYHVPGYRFDMELAKTEMITMRVTKPMKENIKIAAHIYGLSVTEYLTQLHRTFATHASLGEKPEQP